MKQFEILSPHSLSIIDHVDFTNINEPLLYDRLVKLCNTLWFGFRYNGKYLISIGCYKKVLTMQDKVLSSMSLHRATLYYNIAWNYDELRDIGSALEWYFKDLAISEDVHGREVISTAYTYNSLGIIYRKKRNYKNALGYLKHTLYILDRILVKQILLYVQSVVILQMFMQMKNCMTTR